MSSSEPGFRVKLGGFFAKLELKDIVLAYGSEDLTCADALPLADADRPQVAIDGDIGTMTNHDEILSAIAIDGTDFAVVDATGLTAGRAFDVDAFVVEFDVAESFHLVLSEVADNLIRSGNGHG